MTGNEGKLTFMVLQDRQSWIILQLMKNYSGIYAFKVDR